MSEQRQMQQQWWLKLIWSRWGQLFKTGRSQKRTKKYLMVILHKKIATCIKNLVPQVTHFCEQGKKLLKSDARLPFSCSSPKSITPSLSVPHSHLLPHFVQWPKCSNKNLLKCSCAPQTGKPQSSWTG